MLSGLEKLYWTRISLGVLAGFAAESTFRLFGGADAYSNGLLVGVLIYFVSYYLARYGWLKKVGQEQISKLYTTGVGGYTMLFLFVWILLETILHPGV